MTAKHATWRTPAVILTCGCLAVIAFGLRSTLGFFMTPMISLNGWGRNVFAFERTGSYELMWWLAILSGVLSAVINLPIVEKPVVRPMSAAASA